MRRFDLLWLVLTVTPLLADSSLTIATWGGPYEAAQRQVLFEPFQRQTGIAIDTRPYQGGLEILHDPAAPDIVDMTDGDARRACDSGQIRRLDYSLPAAPDGTPAERDFIPGALSRCGIAHLTYATLVAFDERAFPGEKPASIDDFFDLQRFPGKRSLPRTPNAVLEWALMAEGVPLSQVYDLLSTQRGMRLALRRLERLRDHLRWTENPGDAPQLLEQGSVVMAAGFNGRFFAAQARGVPLSIIWDGQIIDRDVWVIPQTTTDGQLQKAREFIRFATRAGRQAALAEHIPYGPTRRSAHGRIGLHPRFGMPMRDHLPNALHHRRRALSSDPRWYARTAKWRRQQFEQWLAQPTP